MIYPWQQKVWQNIADTWDKQPNARLFTGKENTGKTAFARHLAQALLCETPSENHESCGICPSCHLFSQAAHPDFYELSPEIPEEGAGRKLLQIKIDAVRSLIEQVRLTSVRGGRRVVLIYPAESMNAQAANALLKILEEPPENVLFLLVSHSRDKLLPTIKSRCRQTVLPMPSESEALAYLAQHHTENAAELLAFHGGAPLFEHDEAQAQMREKLLNWFAEPRLLAALDYAAAFDGKKWPLEIFLDWMQKWLADVALAQQQMPPLYYPAHTAAARATAERTRAASLFAFQTALNRLAPYGRHTLSVKLQLEYLLTEYLNFWQNKL
ncbi:MAG: DNA polymerase III subunit delta' [Neisseria sp.]|nr:DNA polymerase III subunit delta' [Neisseria sp.]